jgi:hypothetical protein
MKDGWMEEDLFPLPTQLVNNILNENWRRKSRDMSHILTFGAKKSV